MEVFLKKVLQNISQNPQENVGNFVGNFSHHYFSPNTYNQLFLVMVCAPQLFKKKKQKEKGFQFWITKWNLYSAGCFLKFFGEYRYFFSTAQKMKFYIKDFFNKCDQIRSFLRIWSFLLKKSLMENFIFLGIILSI